MRTHRDELLPDVYVECETWSSFNRETLEIRFKGKIYLRI
jgi:excinuclease UvrABC ATPase subunit